MTPALTATAPLTTSWLDREAFPFQPRWFSIDGHRLHYVDEGSGPPLVLVHGTPSWSWEWRAAIAALAPERRVICLDWLGFGLSDKPVDGAYLPADHTRRLAAFLDHLGLDRVALAVHDFGGPVGLRWAVDHPERVRSLAVLNTWCWATADDFRLAGFSRFAATWIGRWFYLRLNASPRWIAPSAWGDRSKLTPEIQRHYLGPFPTPDTRIGPWVLARELYRSSAWYQQTWERLPVLEAVPRTLVWGMRDTAFGPAALDRWRAAWPDAAVVALPEAGHFPQEEATDAVIAALRAL